MYGNLNIPKIWLAEWKSWILEGTEQNKTKGLLVVFVLGGIQCRTDPVVSNSSGRL